MSFGWSRGRGVPGDNTPWIEDRRRLGVIVQRLTLRYGNYEAPVPLDHPALTEGWWSAERNGAALWRWTNGDALLPIDRPAMLLMVELAGANRDPANSHDDARQVSR